ncbi:MAG: hypothetical protein R3236_11815, partial [Phycisphaeraceae bacterium]|nr:hypothetical protein [Phycisphaeraceae bacterium]
WFNLPNFESFSVNDVPYRRGDADFAEGVTKARWIVGIMLTIFGAIGAAPLVAALAGLFRSSAVSIDPTDREESTTSYAFDEKNTFDAYDPKSIGGRGPVSERSHR